MAYRLAVTSPCSTKAAWSLPRRSSAEFYARKNSPPTTVAAPPSQQLRRTASVAPPKLEGALLAPVYVHDSQIDNLDQLDMFPRPAVDRRHPPPTLHFPKLDLFTSPPDLPEQQLLEQSGGTLLDGRLLNLEISGLVSSFLTTCRRFLRKGRIVCQQHQMLQALCDPPSMHRHRR